MELSSCSTLVKKLVKMGLLDGGVQFDFFFNGDDFL